MSYEEWKVRLRQLGPVKFEELCFDLIQSMNFINVDWKIGGADKGRDIEARYHTMMPDRYTEITEKWHFECKLYEDGISEFPEGFVESIAFDFIPYLCPSVHWPTGTAVLQVGSAQLTVK